MELAVTTTARQLKSVAPLEPRKSQGTTGWRSRRFTRPLGAGLPLTNPTPSAAILRAPKRVQATGPLHLRERHEVQCYLGGKTQHRPCGWRTRGLSGRLTGAIRPDAKHTHRPTARCRRVSKGCRSSSSRTRHAASAFRKWIKEGLSS